MSTCLLGKSPSKAIKQHVSIDKPEMSMREVVAYVRTAVFAVTLVTNRQVSGTIV